jgi:hypothetical protein
MVTGAVGLAIASDPSLLSQPFTSVRERLLCSALRRTSFEDDVRFGRTLDLGAMVTATCP